MPTRKHQVGLIGTGPLSELHLATLSQLDRAQVSAIYWRDGADPEALARRYGCRVDAYSNLKEMLSDASIDVVSICAPSSDRAGLAIEAAKAGKHLILETPMALSLQDCEKIKETIDAAKVKVCVCFEARFASQLVTTKAMLGRGLLGRVHYAEVDYYKGYGAELAEAASQPEGHALRVTECQAIDALLFLLGGDVRSVSSYTTRSDNRELASVVGPTTSVSIVRYRDGRLGKVTSTIDCLQPPYFRLHLIGSEGTLLDNQFYTRALGGLKRERWSELAVEPMGSPQAVSERYLAMFRSFFQALDRGQQMSPTGLTEAMLTHELLFAAENSAERHRRR